MVARALCLVLLAIAIASLAGGCSPSANSRRAEPPEEVAKARLVVETEAATSCAWTPRRAPGQLLPFWLVHDPDNYGDKSAWWVDRDGRVFDFVVQGYARPSPRADQVPIAILDIDGSMWSRNGKRIHSCVSPHGEVFDEGSKREDMRCWLTQPCGLWCECDGHHPKLRLELDAGTSTAHIEPAPRSSASCRYTFALLANILIEIDERGHGPFRFRPGD
jgi:hypothetical protein